MKFISALLLGLAFSNAALAAGQKTYLVVSASRCETLEGRFIPLTLAVKGQLVNPTDATTMADIEETDEEGVLKAKVSSENGKVLRVVATYRYEATGEVVSAQASLNVESSGYVSGNKCDDAEDLNKTYLTISVRKQ